MIIGENIESPGTQEKVAARTGAGDPSQRDSSVLPA